VEGIAKNTSYSLAGSGSIYYKGHPSVESFVSGSGKIKQAD
jgi:hypothetical protein